MYNLILMINVYFCNVNCAYIITLFSGAVHLLFCVYSLISFVEFQAFESLLCAPDAISQLSLNCLMLTNQEKCLMVRVIIIMCYCKAQNSDRIKFHRFIVLVRKTLVNIQYCIAGLFP